MSDASRPGPTHVVRRCLVSGRVQGVFYRASAAQRARADLQARAVLGAVDHEPERVHAAGHMHHTAR